MRPYFSALKEDADWSLCTTWCGAIGFAIPMTLSLATGQAVWPNLRQFAFLTGMGVCSFLCQVSVTLFVHFEDAGMVSVVTKAYDILIAYIVQVRTKGYCLY